MKETYEQLKMEVIEFEAEDVITESYVCEVLPDGANITTPVASETAYVAPIN